ncbi:hypothetical protein Lalb_Chr18g0048771 [Lupinus albus]|uniref:Uncharacterized protein n=1 Tax=Lupinus albus TaxID=3870 RepID=A0A6A4NX93_LUPAL|nr:hypothetical protein Lalb_Chr18g0048771 [Lupinus albus]
MHAQTSSLFVSFGSHDFAHHLVYLMHMTNPFLLLSLDHFKVVQEVVIILSALHLVYLSLIYLCLEKISI